MVRQAPFRPGSQPPRIKPTSEAPGTGGGNPNQGTNPNFNPSQQGQIVESVSTPQGPVNVQFTREVVGSQTQYVPTGITGNQTFVEPLAVAGTTGNASATYTYQIQGNQLSAIPISTSGSITQNIAANGVQGVSNGTSLGSFTYTPVISNGQVSYGTPVFSAANLQITHIVSEYNQFTGRFQNVGVSYPYTTAYNPATQQINFTFAGNSNPLIASIQATPATGYIPTSAGQTLATGNQTLSFTPTAVTSQTVGGATVTSPTGVTTQYSLANGGVYATSTSTPGGVNVGGQFIPTVFQTTPGSQGYTFLGGAQTYAFSEAGVQYNLGINPLTGAVSGSETIYENQPQFTQGSLPFSLALSPFQTILTTTGPLSESIKTGPALYAFSKGIATNQQTYLLEQEGIVIPAYSESGITSTGYVFENPTSKPIYATQATVNQVTFPNIPAGATSQSNVFGQFNAAVFTTPFVGKYFESEVNILQGSTNVLYSNAPISQKAFAVGNIATTSAEQVGVGYAIGSIATFGITTGAALLGLQVVEPTGASIAGLFATTTKYAAGYGGLASASVITQQGAVGGQIDYGQAAISGVETAGIVYAASFGAAAIGYGASVVGNRLFVELQSSYTVSLSTQENRVGLSSVTLKSDNDQNLAQGVATKGTFEAEVQNTYVNKFFGQQTIRYAYVSGAYTNIGQLKPFPATASNLNDLIGENFNIVTDTVIQTYSEEGNLFG